MLRFLAAPALLLILHTAAIAQSVAPIDTLFRALGLPEIIEIMREEGIGYGADLEIEMFDGRGGLQWQQTVSDIYGVERLQQTVRNRLDAELAAADLAPMIGFFTSERGREIVRLEVAARRALLDATVEEASKEALAEMAADHDPRLDLLQDFIDAGEMIEYNVEGAMNSNFAFYTGLAGGGAFAEDMSEDEILADIWGQQEAIRDDAEEWLFSYLALAYQPLSDDDLQTYTAFYRSREGAVLNRALFVAFDEMFVDVSLALGQAASTFLSGQEL